MKRTIVLVVLDGWGIGGPDESNPIHVVDPANFKRISEEYPVTSLQASGISVGLPWGEVGNSEVGHLTLGAGKVLYQHYPRITMAIQDGTFFENPALKNAFAHAKANSAAVNLVGLLTKAHTHASLEHMLAIIQMAGKEGVPVNLHLFADGIDSPPRSLESLIAQIPTDRLATLTGRYYAMDRNQNWSLTQRAFECMVGVNGAKAGDLPVAIANYYKRNIGDEFLPPLVVDPEKHIKENDAVIFFNYREDSIRQIAEPFLAPSFDRFPIALPKNLYVTTFSRYEERFACPVAFPPEAVSEPLGKILAEAGKTQLRLAETYKYAHVTYFFNGMAEEPFKNEYRALIPSLNIAHPEERPELMAAAVTDRVVEAIQNQSFDFVLVNYSNPDTIAHTGNYDACLEAVKVIDGELGRILKASEGTPTVLLITSDHGNMEEVMNPSTGEPETQHDANPVPLYLVATEFKGRKFSNWQNIRNQTGGILSDVAPTILELLEVSKPADMTGQSLLSNLL